MNYGYQYNLAAAAAAFYPAAAQAVMQPQQTAPARVVAPNNIQAAQFNPNFNSEYLKNRWLTNYTICFRMYFFCGFSYECF